MCQHGPITESTLSNSTTAPGISYPGHCTLPDLSGQLAAQTPVCCTDTSLLHSARQSNAQSQTYQANLPHRHQSAAQTSACCSMPFQPCTLRKNSFSKIINLCQKNISPNNHTRQSARFIRPTCHTATSLLHRHQPAAQCPFSHASC